jgi:uncharacterized membrane protein YtjA (UPF0391 family)
MNWALASFVTSLIAGLLGFTGISGNASWIAKLLFFLFLVLTLVALVVDAYRTGIRS